MTEIASQVMTASQRHRARLRGEDVPLLVSASPCGTVAAYQRHLRNSEEPCEPCAAAAELPRACARCHLDKAAAEFTSLTAPYCRPCRSEYEAARAKDRIAQDPAYTRMLNLRRYGLTVETFTEMLESQDGKCAICGRDEPGGQGVWHVDHDHRCCSTRKISCGECIRGLLCTRCNIGIGNFGDDPGVIRAAASYLDAHAARRAAHTSAPAV